MDQEWEPLLGGCTQLAAEGQGEEAGDDDSGGDGGGGDGGAVRMSGVLAGKTCAAGGGSVVVVAVVVVAAEAVVAAVGRHPEIDSLVGGCNRHDEDLNNTSSQTPNLEK